MVCPQNGTAVLHGVDKVKAVFPHRRRVAGRPLRFPLLLDPRLNPIRVLGLLVFHPAPARRVNKTTPASASTATAQTTATEKEHY